MVLVSGMALKNGNVIVAVTLMVLSIRMWLRLKWSLLTVKVANAQVWFTQKNPGSRGE